MQGTLFKYGRSSSHLAFKCGDHKRHVILVGGLSDGFLFAPFAPALAKELDAVGWSLVQAQLSSSYLGFGVASLDQDAAELLLLATELKRTYRSQGFVIMGHSTGCQDAVRYTKLHQDGPDIPPLLGVVLQAPVSDREWLGQFPELVRVAEAAQMMASQDRGEDILFRFHLIKSAPVCARRFLSLYQKGGDDDMFSSDLSDGELGALLGHMSSVPCLLLVSGADEYVPASVDAAFLSQRLAAAMGPLARVVLLPGANHSLSNDSGDGITQAVRFIKQLQWFKLLRQWGGGNASPSTIALPLSPTDSGSHTHGLPPPHPMAQNGVQPHAQLPVSSALAVQAGVMTLQALLNGTQSPPLQQHAPLSQHLENAAVMSPPAVASPHSLLAQADHNGHMGSEQHAMIQGLSHTMADGGQHAGVAATSHSDTMQHPGRQHIIADLNQHQHQGLDSMQRMVSDVALPSLPRVLSEGSRHMIVDPGQAVQSPGQPTTPLYHSPGQPAVLAGNPAPGPSPLYHASSSGSMNHGGAAMLVNHQGHLAPGPIMRELQLPGTYPSMVPVSQYGSAGGGGAPGSPTMTELLYDNPMPTQGLHDASMLQQPLHSGHSMLQQQMHDGSGAGLRTGSMLHAAPDSLDGLPLGSPMGAATGLQPAAHNVASFLVSTPHHMDLMHDVLVSGVGSLVSQPSVSQYLNLQSTYNSHTTNNGFQS